MVWSYQLNNDYITLEGISGNVSRLLTSTENLSVSVLGSFRKITLFQWKHLTFSKLLLRMRSSKAWRFCMSSGIFVNWFVPKFNSTILVHVPMSEGQNEKYLSIWRHFIYTSIMVSDNFMMKIFFWIFTSKFMSKIVAHKSTAKRDVLFNNEISWVLTFSETDREKWDSPSW